MNAVHTYTSSVGVRRVSSSSISAVFPLRLSRKRKGVDGGYSRGSGCLLNRSRAAVGSESQHFAFHSSTRGPAPSASSREQLGRPCKIIYKNSSLPATKITTTTPLIPAQHSSHFIKGKNTVYSRIGNMATLSTNQKKHKIAVIGSGNWGSAVAKIAAENAAQNPDLFQKDVQMWVFEEKVEVPKDSRVYDPNHPLCQGQQNLTEVINAFHENVKYLPNITLPKNLHANPSLEDAVKDASILIFNVPHQFILRICDQLQGKVLPYARGISCIKGVNVNEEGVSLFSETIGKKLSIYCGALSGANIATEVAKELWSETTIGYDPPRMDSQAPTPTRGSPNASQVDIIEFPHKDTTGQFSKVKLQPLPIEYPPIDHQLLKILFHRPYFHVRVVSDVAGVSLGGALKNVVAVAAGFVDGLGWGDNAKAAVMRVGLMEMVRFGEQFFGATFHSRTFTEESAGVADLITSCSGGRNFRCAKLSVERKQSIEEVEKQELNGQKLQGTLTSAEINQFLKKQGCENKYPLFTAVQGILEGKVRVEEIPNFIEPKL